MKNKRNQYTIWQIIGVVLAAGVPMWVLGWLIYPALSTGLTPVEAGLLRIQLMGVGLVWQFVFSMIIVYREEGNLRWKTISHRFWLNHPISPKTKERSTKLWWILIPLVLIYVLNEFAVAGEINQLWVKVFPFFAEPEGYSLGSLFENAELRASLLGQWNLFWWFLVMGIFNTFLGEEFVFRGVLLPKMEGVFGKLDWVANGVLFGFYHLSQPWGIPGNIISGLILAFSGKRFRTNWFPIILHSGQTIFILFLILGVVLGLA